MRKRLLVLACVVVLGVVAGFAWRHHSRPIPFNSAVWRNGGPVIRYRMKDDLHARYEAGQLATRRAVDDALGPDDDSSPGSSDYRYFRLREPGIPNPWYLRISFDAKGNVERFMINPD
jgi:hypothetical protein